MHFWQAVAVWHDQGSQSEVSDVSNLRAWLCGAQCRDTFRKE